MSNLIDIIEQDVEKLGKGIWNLSRGSVKGILEGIYTPILIPTASRRLVKDINKNEDSLTYFLGRIWGQLFTASFHIPIASNFIGQGKGKQYFSFLIASNTIDYLVNVYKRSKKQNS